jgi:hypothetical protein
LAVDVSVDAIAALRGVAYFHENQQLIKEVLDSTVERIRSDAVDTPAGEVFSSLLLAFLSDPDRAATVAAAAVMRLAWPDGAL